MRGRVRTRNVMDCLRPWPPEKEEEMPPPPPPMQLITAGASSPSYDALADRVEALERELDRRRAIEYGVMGLILGVVLMSALSPRRRDDRPLARIT